MMTQVRSCIMAMGAALALAGPTVAQQGAIAGRVTNATTLEPVPLARITVVGGAPAREVISDSEGGFQLDLPAGVYDLLVQAPDFALTRFDRVRVRGGVITRKNLPLESQGYRLAGFIVTAGREPLDGEAAGPRERGSASGGASDTEITAPSLSHSVRSSEIAERPAPSPVEHLRESPGVDIGTQGIQASNVVVRGFNNIFSGAMHMLTDYRLAGLPALRVNLLHFLPPNDLDFERMEVVLGPGSALYGPNTANGVLHLITKSPLESSGTTILFGVGGQSIRQGAFRTAFRVNDDFAVKLSGQLFRGREWPHADSTELRARLAAEADLPRCIEDRQSRGVTGDIAEIACARIGIRDYGVRRYGVEARVDWRYSPRGTLVGTYGATDASGIELTPIGATQVDRWIYQFVQGRFTYDRWAVQAYFNFNDSGDAYQLRDGLPLVDHSRLGVIQVQNGFGVAEGRQDFTYGWDYFSTHPQTQGTIYGDYEDDNDIAEWGAYVQSRTRLGRKADLIAAGRVDSHSILAGKVFSPRVALVLKPNDASAFRFAYNRAFATPTALNYFLDLGAGFAPDTALGRLGYTTRAFGTGRDGFGWRRADGTLTGMRSPFNPTGAGELLSADVATLWQMGLAAPDVIAALPPDVLAVLRGIVPTSSDVGISYLDVNRTSEGLRPLSDLTLADVPPMREGSIESFEAGWSGVLGGALRVSLDVYYMTQHDFVSPLTVETPLLFLDGAGIAGWLSSAYVPARAEDLVQRLGLSEEAATAQAIQEAGLLVPQVASGIGRLPLGVVSSDAPALEHGGADLIATYRNVGDLSLWGGDAVVEWLVGPKWTIRGTYSHVSRSWFEIEGSTPLALNAPTDKGSLGIGFRDEGIGLNASARIRYTGAFPFLSTDYDGTRCLPDRPLEAEECIVARGLVDVTLGYKVPSTGVTLQLGVSNLLDTPYRSFVGVPLARRLAMARVRYDLF